MSQAIAALVYAAQEARNTATTTAAASPATTSSTLPPVSDDYPYPETGLQQIGFFILFFFPALALIVVGLRVYSRVSTKQFGWGKLVVKAGLSSLSLRDLGSVTNCSF